MISIIDCFPFQEKGNSQNRFHKTQTTPSLLTSYQTPSLQTLVSCYHHHRGTHRHTSLSIPQSFVPIAKVARPLQFWVPVGTQRGTVRQVFSQAQILAADRAEGDLRHPHMQEESSAPGLSPPPQHQETSLRHPSGSHTSASKPLGFHPSSPQNCTKRVCRGLFQVSSLQPGANEAKVKGFPLIRTTGFSLPWGSHRFYS
jgi:hypothetical protein